jgi:hypothetical protein
MSSGDTGCGIGRSECQRIIRKCPGGETQRPAEGRANEIRILAQLALLIAHMRARKAEYKGSSNSSSRGTSSSTSTSTRYQYQ